MKYISGTQKVLTNLFLAQNAILASVAEAIGRTCVQITIDAKKDHGPGFAHEVGRYENQTTTLTRSITPYPVEVRDKEVTGFVGTSVEYAYPVEVNYPYLFPALQANRENFKKNLKDTMKKFRRN